MNLFCHSAHLQLVLFFFSTFHLTLHICPISSYASSYFPFLTVSFFSHTKPPTSRCLSHFILYTITVVQLPISFGKRKITVSATETPTVWQSRVRFTNRFVTEKLTVRERTITLRSYSHLSTSLDELY